MPCCQLYSGCCTFFWSGQFEMLVLMCLSKPSCLHSLVHSPPPPPLHQQEAASSTNLIISHHPGALIATLPSDDARFVCIQSCVRPKLGYSRVNVDGTTVGVVILFLLRNKENVPSNVDRRFIRPCSFVWGCSPPKVMIPATRETPILIN